MDGNISIIDINANKVVQELKPHTKYVVQVKWYKDGNTFASASHDHTANIYQRKDPDSPFQVVEKFNFSGNVEALAWNTV